MMRNNHPGPVAMGARRRQAHLSAKPRVYRVQRPHNPRQDGQPLSARAILRPSPDISSDDEDSLLLFVTSILTGIGYDLHLSINVLKSPLIISILNSNTWARDRLISICSRASSCVFPVMGIQIIVFPRPWDMIRGSSRNWSSSLRLSCIS